MPKVLALFEFPTVNGGENSWLATVDHLRDVGWNVVAAAPAEGPLACLLKQRQLEHLPLKLSTCDGMAQPLADRRAVLADIIQTSTPDLIHANSLNMARLVGPVAHELRIPSMGHLRDILRTSNQAVTDLNQNSRLICVSQATRQWHLAQGLRADRTVVLYNGVDLDRFRPRPPTGYLHRELGLERHVRIIGSVGQLVVRKGWDLLVNAAETLTCGHTIGNPSNLHFVIAGECYSKKDEAQDYHRDLQRRVTRYPLAEHVTFLGRRDDVPRLLSEFSLLAHPSRQEPLGRVLLEAIACGLPIVATDVGGTPEIFANYPNAAKLVPAVDSSLAVALRAALGNDSWLTAAREHARNCATAGFSHRIAAQGLAKHYFEVLAAGRNPQFGVLTRNLFSINNLREFALSRG